VEPCIFLRQERMASRMPPGSSRVRSGRRGSPERLLDSFRTLRRIVIDKTGLTGVWAEAGVRPEFRRTPDRQSRGKTQREPSVSPARQNQMGGAPAAICVTTRCAETGRVPPASGVIVSAVELPAGLRTVRTEFRTVGVTRDTKTIWLVPVARPTTV
jgi:hypothetical protein